jgi:hypothetical protein
MISAAPAPTKPSVETDAWLTPWKLLLLIATFVVIAFPTVVIGTNSFFYRDMGQFSYPLAQFYREAFWRGEIPFWNPYNNCGLPFLAQWNALVLYPGSLVYLLLPLPWSMNVFVLAHVFLAAAGMYWLALRWTGNRFAASVAGLAFAWNGLTLHALMWPNNIASLGWMPWVVLAMERAWNEGGRRIVFAGLIGAMQMLSAGPEIILLTWLIMGLLWLRDFLRGAVARRRSSLRFVFCGVLVFALCAVQLLPLLDLVRHSQRDTSFGGTVWAMPLWGLANFLVPLFGCTPSVVGVYSQDAQQWTSSYYMGIAVVAFALLSFRDTDGRARWLGGIAIAGLVLSLGDSAFVYTGLKKVLPVLGFIRFPIKYVVLIVFALPLLAAFGVASLNQKDDAQARRRSPLAVILTVMLVLVVLIVIFAWLAPIARTSPATIMQSGVTRMIFLALAIGAMMWLGKQTEPLRRRFAICAVLTLMALDILTHMPRQNPTVPNRAYGPLPSGMSSVPKLGEGRAMISPPMQRMFENAATPDPFTLFTGYRRMLLSDCNLINHVPKVNGFYSLYLREADEVNRQLYRSTNYNVPLIDFLGVSQISDAQEMFAWHARSNAMPFVSAGQAPVFGGPKETFAAIFAPTFDPRRVVYLPAEAQSQLGNIQSNACRVIAIVAWEQSVFAEVEAAAASVVVISQAFYHPWKAYVDGQPAALWKANYAYDAIAIPAGRHKIELRYEDRLFRVGGMISMTALLFCALYLLIFHRGRAASSG